MTKKKVMKQKKKVKKGLSSVLLHKIKSPNKEETRANEVENVFGVYRKDFIIVWYEQRNPIIIYINYDVTVKKIFFIFPYYLDKYNNLFYIGDIPYNFYCNEIGIKYYIF